MATVEFQPLNGIDALDRAIAASAGQPVILFKHSSICPISAGAWQRVHDGLRAGTITAPVYRVVVQEHRPVSNAIAERFGIRHESPQAFVIHDGKVLHHASHQAITAESLAKVIRS